MPKTRYRFTIRNIMIAIAIVAITCWILIGRRTRFARLAAYHEAHVSHTYLEGFEGLPFDPSNDPRIPLSDWHEAMADKYRAAAANPWLSFAPESPEVAGLPSSP